MALRVADAGVGSWVDKTTFTPTELRDSLLKVRARCEVDSGQVGTEMSCGWQLIADRDGQLARSLRRISSSLRLAGGVQRAADLIEDFAEVS